MEGTMRRPGIGAEPKLAIKKDNVREASLSQLAQRADCTCSIVWGVVSVLLNGYQTP